MTAIRKYGFVFTLYLQEGLQNRGSFFMERFRSMIVLLSFYFLWSALLQNRPSFAGYDRSEMLTYVLGMSILRSLVFASQTYELAWEINQGRLSNFLMKPITFVYYTFFRDLSEKTINFVSAIVEVLLLSWLLDVPWKLPSQPWMWGAFFLSVSGAILIYFSLVFALGCIGFWTAESGGPRFLLELILEFTAGAFFPLSVLPVSVQQVLHYFPSPYLVSFPINLFLGKLSWMEAVQGLGIQAIWVLFFILVMRWAWRKGLAHYNANGG